MSDIIQNLAEHCDFYVGNEHYDKSKEVQQILWMEKFAELIVLECADWLSHREFASPEALKHHFGVKE